MRLERTSPCPCLLSVHYGADIASGTLALAAAVGAWETGDPEHSSRCGSIQLDSRAESESGRRDPDRGATI